MTIFSSALAVVAVVSVLAVGNSGVDAGFGFSNCTDMFVNENGRPFFPAVPQRENAVELCVNGVLATAYRPKYRDPAWSAIYVTPEDAKNNIPGRYSHFYEDPTLKAASIQQADPDSDTWSSEWNRGHLIASRINSYTEVGKVATYDVINIAPQEAYFNQRIWLQMENDIFEWLDGGIDALNIVVGVRIDPDNVTWGADKKIAIPDYFWCAACSQNKRQSAAWWGWNAPSTVQKKAITSNKQHLSGSSSHPQFVRSATGNNHPSLGFVSLATVDELAEKIAKFGDIFPKDLCRTNQVDPDYWGFSSTNYGRTPNDTPYSELSKEQKRNLYRESRLQFKMEKRESNKKKLLN